MRLALIQLAVGASKADNLQRASKLIAQAAQGGAKLISLPVSLNFFRVLSHGISMFVCLQKDAKQSFDMGELDGSHCSGFCRDKGLFRISCLGGGVVLFRKSARKKSTPPQLPHKI